MATWQRGIAKIEATSARVILQAQISVDFDFKSNYYCLQAKSLPLKYVRRIAPLCGHHSIWSGQSQIDDVASIRALEW